MELYYSSSRMIRTRLPKTFWLTITVLLACSSLARAQDPPGHFELGGSITTVRNFPGNVGVGIEADFNLGRYFAVDAALDWLPTRNAIGNSVIGLFGAKVGTRKQHFGYFAKVRPGVLTIDNVFREAFISPSLLFTRSDRLTERVLDLGGVAEYYPARHWALRWDLSDMLIFQDPGPTFTDIVPGQGFVTTTPSKVTNNFRFSSGLQYRF
jgi:hypothetical protein